MRTDCLILPAVGFPPNVFSPDYIDPFESQQEAKMIYDHDPPAKVLMSYWVHTDAAGSNGSSGASGSMANSGMNTVYLAENTPYL